MTDVYSDKNQLLDKFSANPHNNTHSIIQQEDILVLDRKNPSELNDEPIMKNFMGFVNESPLEQNFLGQKDKDSSLPSHSSMNYQF